MFSKKLAISREEVEKKLLGHSNGTFVIRWSPRVESFVLSFLSGNKVMHYSDIQIDKEGRVNVKRSDGAWSTFHSSHEYVTDLRKRKIVTNPFMEYC